MTDETGTISVSPEIRMLEDVLRELAEGRLRVPRFQRPFVWRPDQMLRLFDSIEYGYPIGSLLVWETDQEIVSLDQVADVDIPTVPGGSTSFLLDGHQRLSTLFGCLWRLPSGAQAGTGQRHWQWEIYRVLGTQGKQSDNYQHWKRDGEPDHANWLPMRSVLRTMDFLGFSRRLTEIVDDEPTRSRLIDEAERLAHQVKSCQIPVVRIKGGDLDRAVEVYSRLNSTGQSMTPEQMVSALAAPTTGTILADRIGNILEDLGSIGYGRLARMTIFRSVLAVAGEPEIQDTRWDRLAKRVTPHLEDAVTNTDRALRGAVDFLRQDIHAPLARLIPYQLQVLLLTVFFHHTPSPSEEQKLELKRWFWGTSWSGHFAGLNSTQVKDEVKAMRRFATGAITQPWRPEQARPFPDRFDLRSARVRAFVLWELQHYPKRWMPYGADPLNPVDVLARSDTDAYQHVIWNAPSSSHPANRMIMPTAPGVSVRSALKNLEGSVRTAVLDSHGIPRKAQERLVAGDDEEFILERAAELEAREREFMIEMGIEPAAERSGEADIDTE